MSMTLQDLLAPITPEQFFAEHYDKAPLHVEGGAAKFAAVLDWAGIDRLLDMSHLWSETTLKLLLDSKPIPPEQYSVRATAREGAAVLQPVAARVHEWVRRGATLALNYIDSMTPGLRAAAGALEGAGLGKAQANLYISWQSHKAFTAHYDTHDVWALQVEGEKAWNIWSGRGEWPIAHPLFRGQTQEQIDRAKGPLRARIVLKKGDLLYLPRGWYHDALAEAPNSAHIAFGVHAPLGLDFLNILSERVLYETEFRRPLPRQDGSPEAEAALTARAAAFGARLAELARDPKVLEVLKGFVRDYRYDRGGFDLLAARQGVPEAPAPEAAAGAAAAASYQVRPAGTRPVRRGSEFGLQTPAGVLAMTLPEVEAAAWVLARPSIAEPDLKGAFPAIDSAGLINRLRDAGVLSA